MRLPEPIKSLPSAPLQRPFRLFGRGFEVKLSSQLTIVPDVILWITTGMSFQQAFESFSPAHGRAMKDFRRGLEGKNTLSPTTVGRIRQTLLPRIQARLTQDEIFSLLPVGLPWRILSDSLRKSSGGDDAEWDLLDAVERLADLEALPEKARALVAQGKTQEAEELIAGQIGHPHHYWGALNIPTAPSLIIDGALQVNAYIEGKWSKKLEELGPNNFVSPARLLDDSRTPIGNWLVRQQQLAGCKSLAKLSSQIPADSSITIDRLKDWSAGRNLMPPAAAEALVNMLHRSVLAESEMRRYRQARLFSFLVEFVICATEGDPPTWRHAQAMVKKRYCDLLQAATPQAG